MTKLVIKQFHVRDRLLKVERHSENADDWASSRTARNKAVSPLHSAQREFYIRMALNVICVTIIQFQCYRFCLESLSAMYTIRYALFSAMIT